MVRKNVLLLLFMSIMLFAAFNLFGCGAKSIDEERVSKEKIAYDETKPTTEGSIKDDGMVNESPGNRTGSNAGESQNQDLTTSSTTPPTDDQSQEKIPTKIIKTADISYQVEKFEQSRKTILAIVNKYKAYVSSEDQTNDGYRISNVMTIRVDAPVFDSLVDALMSESIYVEYKKISAMDVTEEYVDLTARLKSKKEVEAQYEAILKKANSINEILQVQQYLRTIREEIDSFEGRLKYMNDRVSYSTITLKFYEQLDNVSKQPDRTFGSRMGEAFSWGWNGLVNFFLGIIYLWPLWLILGFTAWLIVFLIKRGNRRRKAAKEALQK
jgi:hypothetical protein